MYNLFKHPKYKSEILSSKVGRLQNKKPLRPSTDNSFKKTRSVPLQHQTTSKTTPIYPKTTTHLSFKQDSNTEKQQDLSFSFLINHILVLKTNG